MHKKATYFGALTGRIFCTAVVIRAGLTVDVVFVASLMATASIVSAGIIGILQKEKNTHTPSRSDIMRNECADDIIQNENVEQPAGGILLLAFTPAAHHHVGMNLAERLRGCTYEG